MPPSSLGLILFKCISFKIIKIWTFNANIANIKIAIQVSGPWKKWDPDLPIAVSFGKSFPHAFPRAWIRVQATEILYESTKMLIQ